MTNENSEIPDHLPDGEFGPPIKQDVFLKPVSELFFGDVVVLSADELEGLQENETAVGTFLGIEQDGTFGVIATLLFEGDDHPRKTKRLDLVHYLELGSLEGQDTLWVDVENLQAGHVLSNFDRRVKIEEVIKEGQNFVFHCKVVGGDEQADFTSPPGKTYKVRVSEPDEAKKLAYERELAKAMIVEDKGDAESIDDYLRRIIEAGGFSMIIRNAQGK